jgi:glycosyltransferase involved in cell wall biosynthesis
MGALRTRGHEQLLLAPGGPLLERAAAGGFGVQRWDSRGEIDVAALLAARSALARFRPQVAHCHSAHAHAIGVPAARWAGVPAVVVARRVDFRVRTNLFSRLKYALSVDRYLCISAGVRAAMLASGVPAGRMSLVPSGLEFSELHAAAARAVPELRQWAGLPADAEVLGTVASLAPHKNHALLLEAAPAVIRARPRAQFVWLGEGECRPALEKRRAELGLESRVHMLGFHAEARAFMRQFDLFVLASSLEGLCTSLLDAQVLGVPIVATAVGGVPEVVEDGVNGRLVHTLDPAPLAAALVEALADSDQRAAWVAKARTTVEAFSIDNTAERTLTVYREVLRERAHPI